MTPTMASPPEKVAWSITEWRQAVGCSRGQVYNLIARHEIDSRVMGTKRLILTPPLDYVRGLPEKADAA